MIVSPVLLLALEVLRQRVVPVDVLDVRNGRVVLKKEHKALCEILCLVISAQFRELCSLFQLAMPLK